MRRAAIAGIVLASSIGARAEAPRIPAGCRPRPPIEGREVTAEAAERLRALPGTSRLPRAGEYRLRDGRVLVLDAAGDGGVLLTPAEYERRRGLVAEELRLRRAFEGEAFHPLRGLIDDGAAFGGQAAALQDALRQRLAREGLPPNVEGAEALAARAQKAGCRLDPALLRELSALAGQLALDKLGAAKARGAWATRDEDGFAAPVIEWDTALKRKKTLSPWRLAARLLEEDGARLGKLVEAALAAAPLDPPPPGALPPAPPDGGSPDGGPSDGGAAPDAVR